MKKILFGLLTVLVIATVLIYSFSSSKVTFEVGPMTYEDGSVAPDEKLLEIRVKCVGCKSIIRYAPMAVEVPLKDYELTALGEEKDGHWRIHCTHCGASMELELDDRDRKAMEEATKEAKELASMVERVHRETDRFYDRVTRGK